LGTFPDSPPGLAAQDATYKKFLDTLDVPDLAVARRASEELKAANRALVLNSAHWLVTTP